MIDKKEIKGNWEKINSQLDEVKRFLNEDKLDEALYFIWLAAENIVAGFHPYTSIPKDYTKEDVSNFLKDIQ